MSHGGSAKSLLTGLPHCAWPISASTVIPSHLTCALSTTISTVLQIIKLLFVAKVKYVAVTSLFPNSYRHPDPHPSPPLRLPFGMSKLIVNATDTGDNTAMENVLQRELDCLNEAVREDLRACFVDQRQYFMSESSLSKYMLWLLTMLTHGPLSGLRHSVPNGCSLSSDVFTSHNNNLMLTRIASRPLTHIAWIQTKDRLSVFFFFLLESITNFTATILGDRLLGLSPRTYPTQVPFEAKNIRAVQAFVHDVAREFSPPERVGKNKHRTVRAMLLKVSVPPYP